MKRGELYYVAIPFTTGHEIQKNRPAVIVSNDTANEHSPMVSVVFMSTSDHRPDIPSHVPVTCRGEVATALVEQCYCVDKSRVENYIGQCKAEEMEAIDKALAEHYGLKASRGNRVEVERDLLMKLVCTAMGGGR